MIYRFDFTRSGVLIEMAALVEKRRATIEWQFTNRQARVKLKELYPAVDNRRD